jgi:predicted metal-dependent phosphoesterase TrpH
VFTLTPIRAFFSRRRRDKHVTTADLHVHTDNSDGVLSLDAVPGAARDAGLGAVAITDHDRPHPDLDAPVVDMEGVTVIHGIELRVEGSGGRIDLLGYGLDPTPALREAVARIQRDRMERGAEMIDRVEARLGIDLDIESREGIGRPHIARAIADHPDADHEYGGVFEHLIGDDGPCYVARSIPDFERGRELLAAACSVVGLAHPLRYDDPEAALDHAASLDAVERWYPYGEPTDATAVREAIDAHGLLATGGSDAHGETLGVAGLDAAAYRAVRTRLPDPA